MSDRKEKKPDKTEEVGGASSSSDAPPEADEEAELAVERRRLSSLLQACPSLPLSISIPSNDMTPSSPLTSDFPHSSRRLVSRRSVPENVNLQLRKAISPPAALQLVRPLRSPSWDSSPSYVFLPSSPSSPSARSHGASSPLPPSPLRRTPSPARQFLSSLPSPRISDSEKKRGRPPGVPSPPLSSLPRTFHSPRMLSPLARSKKEMETLEETPSGSSLEQIRLPARPAADDSSGSDDEDEESEETPRESQETSRHERTIFTLGETTEHSLDGSGMGEREHACSTSLPYLIDETSSASSRHASFLYRKRPSDSSLGFFSASFVSPVSLDDSCFNVGISRLQSSISASAISCPIHKSVSGHLHRVTAKSGSVSTLIANTERRTSSCAVLSGRSAEVLWPSPLELRECPSPVPVVPQAASALPSPSSPSMRPATSDNVESGEYGSAFSLSSPPTSLPPPPLSIDSAASSAGPSTSTVTLQSTAPGRLSPPAVEETGKEKEEQPMPAKYSRVGGLRVVEVLSVRVLQIRGLRGSSSKPVFLVAKLDNDEIHRSGGFPKNNVTEEFTCEVGRFCQLHLVVLEGGKDETKSARPLGMISLRRKDIARNCGKERLLPLRVVSTSRDVQGQICLDIRRSESKVTVKVVDYCDVNVEGSSRGSSPELYAIVEAEGKGKTASTRLRIGPSRVSESVAEMKCPHDGTVHIKMSLWHELLRGLNAVFHGQVRVEIPSEQRCAYSPSKWFYLRAKVSDSDSKVSDKERDADEKESSSSRSWSSSSLGEMRVWLSYTAEHVLPLETYSPLLEMITSSLSSRQFFAASLVALFEYLPQMDLGLVARPLVHIFDYSHQIRPLLCQLYMHEVEKCQDWNTLFRSQSLVIKMLNELLRLYGQQYLLSTLKPIVDTVYKERKCCEVDPSRLKESESLEKNVESLVSYFTSCFGRVVGSACRCPQPLRLIFADLRSVVARGTGKRDVELLALSSFLIMRFFAPALVNPKSFGMRKEQPPAESRVGRTLVLLSKILQRLANCVVSSHPLTSKEPWLDPILEQLTNDEHKTAMCRFLDQISLAVAIDEEADLVCESPSMLKEGTLVQCSQQARTWKRVIRGRQKKTKRHVILTPAELCWQKMKTKEYEEREERSGSGSSREGEEQRIPLSDIASLHSRNCTLVLRAGEEDFLFEAADQDDLHDWLSAIEEQRRVVLSSSSSSPSKSPSPSQEWPSRLVDIERELEAVHVILIDKADTLAVWRNCLGAKIDPPVGTHPLPKLHVATDDEARTQLLKTLEGVLAVIYTIEQAHREAISNYSKQMKSGAGTRENPIGNDHYLLVKRKQSLL